MLLVISEKCIGVNMNIEKTNKRFGYMFPVYSKQKSTTLECFVCTDRSRKTDSFLHLIIRKLLNYGIDIPDNPDVRSELKYWMNKAELFECIDTDDENKIKWYSYKTENQVGGIFFPDDILLIDIK